ncbi:MAG: hypothetical protein CVT77_07275 [Alphaproteobacteria bacterium HGW-Alphaproteobacteria-16]|nr:MAG: hypothetical protein CVT77_07275 [Alphaproteobacteria bacterium HGW-Alphaproteobacteria-16]
MAALMKTVTTNQLNGEFGETLVKARVMKLGHVFQGTGRMETGIDGTIEFRDPQTGRMTGKMVAVQVKTREKGDYTAESDTSFEYLMRTADLDYWRSSSLPVVLILHRLSDDSFFWKGVSDGAPGEERRLLFDKVRDRLDSAAMDRLAALSVERGRLGSHVPPMRTGELAHLNLMRIGLPDEIFVADSPFASGRNAIATLLATEERHFDWVIRGRRFVSFRDPRGTGLESIVDVDTIEAVDTELIADSDDPDDEVVMIELLRRTMVEQLSEGLAWEQKSRTLYFRAAERYQTRKYEYRSLREPTSAMVVQVYFNKKRKDEVHSVRHHGFNPRFERIGGEWFLSISPTFIFTEDGFRLHRFSADLLAGKKRKDRNGSIRGQVFLFRFLLSGANLGADSPMFDLFGGAGGPAPAQQFLRFETMEPVEMEVAVPEEAWAVSDPNAKKMKAENDDVPIQHTLEIMA